MGLELDTMSIEEKLKTMEMLWNDICQRVPDFSSPSWHGDLLEERELNLKEGRDQFMDWEKAKKDIWKSIS
ncbi:conserved hypothetical protein [uncultured Desulfobacterium sp.]|uniref:Addiction module component n=1 Tax=uncultured Desulfobacterium sp. TaxID=201089 RepID=A0A445N015_9BACT|nr:conserved hypothetical protein [uncultured Desulfobacterium sp.]